MKILAMGDFHGKVPITKEFLRKNNIDIIISQGDFPRSEKIRKIIFKNWAKLNDEGKSLEEITGKNEWKKILNEEIKSQTKVLRKLDSLDIPILTIFGNAEHRNEIENFLKKSKNIRHIGLKKIKINEIYFIGIDAMTNKNEEQIELEEMRLMQMFKGLRKKVVLISHESPYDTKFDIVKNKESPRFGEHVGSKVVKNIVKTFKPLVNVFGHMHENFGKGKIGRTYLVNAGYGHDGHAAIITLDNEKSKVKLLKL